MSVGNVGPRRPNPFATFPTFQSFLTLLTFLSFLTACRASPQKELEQIQQQVASWDATAQLTSELAQRGALPSVYVRQVSEAVEQGKQKARQQAAKGSQ